MTEFALQFGVSNLLVSSVLALVAWAVQRSGQRAMLAHLLWLLVLAKLLTPPVFTVPLLDVGAEVSSEGAAPWGTAADDVASLHALGAMGAAEGATPAESAAPAGECTAWNWIAWLGWAWFLGSALVLTASLVRIMRFDRLLRASSTPAPEVLQRQAEILGRRLGLTRIPAVRITEARISPMVWWAFGSCRIYLPEGLPEELGSARTRWVLAHELAHVRRRDHLVRWLEWLACVAFWWNPITWWARRNLRVHEELCCDALVMGALRPKPETYATSLLGVLEFLSASVLRPPALASEARGGFLERRFHMILNSQNARPVRRLHALAVLAAVVFLPLGIAYAQDPNYDAVATRLVKAVESGELSVQQAESMMGELARARFREHLRDHGGSTAAKSRSRWSNEAEQKKSATIAESLRRDLVDKVRRVDATKKLQLRVKEQYERQVKEYQKRAAEAEARARDLRDQAVERRSRREGERREVDRTDVRRRSAGVDSARRTADLLRLREMSAKIDATRREGDLSTAEARKKLEELRRSMAELREKSERSRREARGTDRLPEARSRSRRTSPGGVERRRSPEGETRERMRRSVERARTLPEAVRESVESTRRKLEAAEKRKRALMDTRLKQESKGDDPFGARSRRTTDTRRSVERTRRRLPDGRDVPSPRGVSETGELPGAGKPAATSRRSESPLKNTIRVRNRREAAKDALTVENRLRGEEKAARDLKIRIDALRLEAEKKRSTTRRTGRVKAPSSVR